MTKLKISIAIFLLVVISTITTVYAWIALANVNKIHNISLSAVAKYELKMSLDGINYYNEIPKEVILKELKNLKFDDVTSSDGVNFNSYYSGSHKAIANRDYISLTIYFQTTSRFHELYLEDNRTNISFDNPPEEGTYIVSRGRNFKTNISYQYGPDEFLESGAVKTYFAHDAMRVSFTNEVESFTKIFDLSGNPNRGFGITEFGAYDYYYKTEGIKIDLPTTIPNTLYELTTFDEEDNPNSDVSYLITLEDKGKKTEETLRPIYEGKLTMNIWLEGYDADAMDAILSDQLKMQFMFKAIRPQRNNN